MRTHDVIRVLGCLLVTTLLAASGRGRAWGYTINGLDGPPTAAELASLKAGFNFDLNAPLMTCAAAPCGPFNIYLNNNHNNYVYGETGGAMEGMIALYQVSKDPQVLDKMIWAAQVMLARRNDRYQRRTIFTGKVEACWPNKTPDAVDGGYCGTEQGDVLGHISSVALEIARSPSLWMSATPVPDFLKLGPTYLDRARGLIAECRQTLDGFIIPQMVDPQDNRFRFPEGDGYRALGPRYTNDAGKHVPWNQNAMLANGFLSVAMALDLLGDDPVTVTRYVALEKAWIDAFLVHVTRSQVMGNEVYNWCYGSDQTPPGCSEDIGHGGYDFWGVYRAYAWPKLAYSRAQLEPFANTFRFVMMLPGGGFAGKVDGTGTASQGPGSTYLYAAYFRHDVYQAVAQVLLPAATTKNDPDSAGRLLWAKYMNSRNWQDEASYGDGGVRPPQVDAARPADARTGAVDAAMSADASTSGPADASTSGGAGGGGSPGAGGSGGSGGSAGAGAGPPTTRPTGASGCGCRLGSSSSAGTLPLIIVLVALRRRHLRF